MIQALVIKELREVRGIAVLALIFYALVVGNLIGLPLVQWDRDSEVPFVSSPFVVMLAVVSIVFAVGLGLRQSLGESVRGTYLFLLHRPIARNGIFLAKLGTGLSVFVLCAAAPILGYGVWAAIPGHHASPFEWSMTESAWRLCGVLPLLYLGAFLSGVRPARWFGTRLLPLLASGLCVFLVLQTPWWWPLGLVLTLVSYALLIATVCHVAGTRDYA